MSPTQGSHAQRISLRRAPAKTHDYNDLMRVAGETLDRFVPHPSAHVGTEPMINRFWRIRDQDERDKTELYMENLCQLAILRSLGTIKSCKADGIRIQRNLAITLEGSEKESAYSGLFNSMTRAIGDHIGVSKSLPSP